MVWLMLILWFLAADVYGATHYIRDGGTASTTGTGACNSSGAGNWNTANACDQLPATLVRGDTYCIADGSYNGTTFSTANSGTTVITIKKATVADHCSQNTGWLDTYGDGQASFGVMSITTSNWTITGIFRNENDWWDGTAYGFKVATTADAKAIIISNNPNNIILDYLYIVGNNPPTDSAIGPYALIMNQTDPGNSTGIEWKHLLVSGSSNNMVPWNSTGTLIEYCALDDNWGTSGNHGESINAYFSVFDLTVRYNKIRVGNGTAAISVASDAGSGNHPRLFVYGNLFYDWDAGDGSIGFLGSQSSDGDMSNSRIYNNTFVNMIFNGDISAPQGTGNLIRNNLWVTYGNSPVGIDSPSSTKSHNAISGSTGPTMGTSLQVNVPTSIFVNYASRDLRLASATAAGVVLTNETINGRLHTYDRDMLGNVRGGDGTWDRGAYEFVVGDSTPPSAPANLFISQAEVPHGHR